MTRFVLMEISYPPPIKRIKSSTTMRVYKNHIAEPRHLPTARQLRPTNDRRPAWQRPGRERKRHQMRDIAIVC